MNIKHGDIITLENGDNVKVHLEIITKKITELKVNKSYKLKENKSFCFISEIPAYDASTFLKNNRWVFIGKINICTGERYIFSNNVDKFAMFGTNNLDFVVSEIN
jgi:hypothetical protein